MSGTQPTVAINSKAMDELSQPSIKVDAKECQELFADLLSLPGDAILTLATDLQDEYGRFNLWAATMAVFAPDQACLDFRLKDVPEARDLFVKQLGVLATRLEQLFEQLDPDHIDMEPDSSPQMEPWDVDDILPSIHETIDWLHRLSNLVRKASLTTQNEKAAAFVLRDETGADMTENLLCFYEALIKRDCKGINDQLVHRLANTMILRRKRILYRQTRQRRWILQQAEDTRRKLDVLPAQPTKQSQDDGTPQDEDMDEIGCDTKSSPNNDRITPSTLTATVVDREKYLKQGTPSRISRATSAPFQPSEKLLVPPRPLAAEEGREFVCDYCCLILPSDQASNRDKWANHVKKDLDPYICVFDDCPEPYQLYSSSEEWLAHMSSQHRTRWHCTARDHPPLALETREEFIAHMDQVHPGRFKKAQLGFVADSCARPLAPTIPNCPFCTESTGNLDAHVGQHLQCFALQSMPWPKHLTQDAEDTSEYGSDDSASSEWLERATLGDTFDDIPPFRFSQLGPDVDHSPDFPDESAADLVQADRSGFTPLLDSPVVYPVIDRRFPKIDETLEKFAASMRANRGPWIPDEDILGDPEGAPSPADGSVTEPTVPEESAALEKPAVYQSPWVPNEGIPGNPEDAPSSSDAVATGPPVSDGDIGGTAYEETTAKEPTSPGLQFSSPLLFPALPKEGLEDIANEEAILDMNEPAAANPNAFKPQLLVRGSKGQTFKRFDNIASSHFLAGRGEIGKAEIACEFLFTKSQWGVLGRNKIPSAILFWRLQIHTPWNTWLQSCSISMTLSDHPDEGAAHSLIGRQKVTEFFGPRSLVSHFSAAERSGSRSAGQSSRSRLSSHIRPSAGSIWDDTIIWDIEYDNPEIRSTKAEVYHLAFAIEHSAQDFYLKTKVTGKLSSRSERIKRMLKFNSKNEEIVTKFEFHNEYTSHRRLDQVAASLDQAMVMENSARTPVELPEPFGPADFYPAHDASSSMDSLAPDSSHGPVTTGTMSDGDKEAIRLVGEEAEETAKLAAPPEAPFAHPTEVFLEQGGQRPSTSRKVPRNQEDRKAMPPSPPPYPEYPARRPSIGRQVSKSEEDSKAMPPSPPPYPEYPSHYPDYYGYEPPNEKSSTRRPPITRKASQDEEDRGAMPPPPRRPASAGPTGLAFRPPPSTPARRRVDVDKQDPDVDDPLFHDPPPRIPTSTRPVTHAYRRSPSPPVRQRVDLTRRREDLDGRRVDLDGQELDVEDYVSRDLEPLAPPSWIYPPSMTRRYDAPGYQTEVAGRTLRRQSSAPSMMADDSTINLTQLQEYAAIGRARGTGKMTTDTPDNKPAMEQRVDEAVYHPRSESPTTRMLGYELPVEEYLLMQDDDGLENTRTKETRKRSPKDVAGPSFAQHLTPSANVTDNTSHGQAHNSDAQTQRGTGDKAVGAVATRREEGEWRDHGRETRRRLEVVMRGLKNTKARVEALKETVPARGRRLADERQNYSYELTLHIVGKAERKLQTTAAEVEALTNNPSAESGEIMNRMVAEAEEELKRTKVKVEGYETTYSGKREQLSPASPNTTIQSESVTDETTGAKPAERDTKGKQAVKRGLNAAEAAQEASELEEMRANRVTLEAPAKASHATSESPSLTSFATAIDFPQRQTDNTRSGTGRDAGATTAGKFVYDLAKEQRARRKRLRQYLDADYKMTGEDISAVGSWLEIPREPSRGGSNTDRK